MTDIEYFQGIINALRNNGYSDLVHQTEKKLSVVKQKICIMKDCEHDARWKFHITNSGDELDKTIRLCDLHYAEIKS